MLAHQRGIAAVLVHYEEALNASNTNGVTPLYAEDSVFMPPFSPSAVATAAVRQTYDSVINAIRLSVKFDVIEMVRWRPIGPSHGLTRRERSPSTRQA
jgi:ketosteroid isomerase-like protein